MLVSTRLRHLAELLPPVDCVADIACDHGLLAVHLVQSGRCRRAICGDLRREPCNAARRNIKHHNLHDAIQVRQGDGLSILAEGEANALVIAGVGGQVIRNILHAGRHRLSGLECLVLQPQGSEAAIRSWLYEHSWKLYNETLTEESGYYYETLVARPGDGAQGYRNSVLPPDFLFETGPTLAETHPALFCGKWRAKQQVLQDNYNNMLRSTRPETREKRENLAEFLTLLDSVLERAERACNQSKR